MPNNKLLDLIPRELLFGNPDKAMARISPDGTQLSYLAPVDGVLNVWVSPAENLDDAKPVTNDPDRGIRSYTWSYTNHHILYIQDKGGDENWRIYSVDLQSGETTDLTPFDEVKAQIIESSPDYPTEILVGLNNRTPQLHDIHRLNIETGEMTLVYENEGFLSFITDMDYNLRYALRMTPDGGSEVMRRFVNEDGEDDWMLFAKIAMEDSLTTQPIGMNSTGDTLYMIDSRGRDTAAVMAVNAETDESTLLAEDARADAGGAMTHPTKQTVEAVSFTYTRREWTILDDTIADDLAFLQTVADGEVDVVSRSQDDQAWIVAYTMDNGPIRYYFYDRTNQQSRFLFTNRTSLEDLPLTHMHPVVIPARDGFNLVSYYSLPSGSFAKNEVKDETPRPDQALPLILLVHGGPWSRDHWGYNPLHQLFANRGYAVLSVNFRSSTGFGKAFLNAGNLEWGKKMHDDLLDAVNWAVESGIADRNQVAIMGGSYGGYATLAGLTFTPDVFACGVDIVGPSNLNTLLNSVPEYWKPMIDMMYTRVGNPNTEEGQALLKERSPLTHADKIQRPLLIGQGANDPRVKQAESDQIVQAMQKKNIPVTYVLYPDEGHGFARPENSLSFFAVAEAFLAKCLENERYEPIAGPFEGSSIQVPAGAGDVPGLEAVMAERT
ncbi:MAG: S9 family peptidase [Chloroflexota bacterium]